LSVIAFFFEAGLASDDTIIFQGPSKMKAPFSRFAYTLAAVAVAGYAAVTLTGPHGIGALMAKHREIRTLEDRNAALTRENERRLDRIDQIKQDPAKRELLIRKNLKMVKEGEKVFLLPID
jgi:cell division protein FtsB